MSMFAAYFADIRLLDLEILAASNAIDVLCVSKTWLSDICAKPVSPRVNLPGFQTPFRCDRILATVGVEVLLFMFALVCVPPGSPCLDHWKLCVFV